MARNQTSQQERRGRLCVFAAILVLVSACSDAPSASQVNEEIFGGTPPTDAQLATYPKILPAGAFAAGNALRAASDPAPIPTPSSFVIPESALPPVQAQGTASNFGYPGSCEVWSAGYAMGSYAANLTNQNDIKDLANTVSTAYVYMTVLNVETKSCGSGTGPGDTLDYLVANTAPSLASIPYYPVCECPSGSDQCLDAVTLDQSCASNPEFCTALSIGSWAGFEKKPIEQILAMIKTWLGIGYIVQITIVVPYDFKDYTSGVYDAPASCPAPQPTNCAQHGAIACIASSKEKSGCAQHGVAIVGYDDALGALMIQNSFGTSWGEQGYIWMSYATFEAIYLSGTIAFAPSASVATSAPSDAAPISVTEAGFQWVDRRDAGTPSIDLIFASTLGRPIALGTITISTPDGRILAHDYGHWFRNGYHYVTRHDGKQFPPGKYTVRLEGTTREGESVVFANAVAVALVAGETLPPAPIGNDVTGTNGQPVRAN